MTLAPFETVTDRCWAATGDQPVDTGRVAVTGRRQVLPSVFDVTGFAVGAVAAAARAGAALTDLLRPASAVADPVAVDSRAAAAAFLSEHLLTPLGWSVPPIWDPLAGDYQATDGWVRIHTNYEAHRRAAVRALGFTAGPDPVDRPAVAAVVAGLTVDEVEELVVAAGGCAAVMRSREAWARHEHGRAVAAEPPLRSDPAPPAPARWWPSTVERPALGLRVLDLTRVLAGPVCTRVLAALGADVLRIDPPDFREVPAVVPDTSVGKHCAALDLRTPAGRDRLLRLAGDADVIVHGLRPGAMEALRLDTATLRDGNAGLVTARIDAYGWQGPWSGRRGFDSLVQMSCGIAAAPAGDHPVPLPAQALDHGAGYLLAAAVLRAVGALAAGAPPVDLRASLIGTANLLVGLPGRDAADDGSPIGAPVAWDERDTVEDHSAWGPLRRVPLPFSLAGVDTSWSVEAGPLGRHAPEFAGR